MDNGFLLPVEFATVSFGGAWPVQVSSVCCPASSVVDPNTLNLDPDPGFWSNLDLDPGPGLYN